MDALITKKISRPILSRTILHRKELIDKLCEVIVSSPSENKESISTYKLVVLCAPAGYGKTTLLADFAQHTSVPCCWYFLDSTDAEESNFLKTLILSILHYFPQLETALNPLLVGALSQDGYSSTPGPRFDEVIDALVPAIESEISERFAIFLCNYHTINHSQKINKLVNRLLRKLPPQCVLIIESRAIPDLNFVSLLAHDEVIGLDQHFLHFTTADICNLAHLQRTRPLQKKEAERLNILFDGWIVGILLGTHLGDTRILHAYRDVYKPTSVPDIQIDRQKIFAYLVNEVFSQNSEVYAFLKDAVVLQQMTAVLCNALLECNDAAVHLQYLEQQGLFVTRTNDEFQDVYTCHPIIRELLCDELRRQFPDRCVALHRRAMELWSEAHDYEQAIYHALEAHLNDEATHLILKAHEQMSGHGRGEVLSNWIDALPPEMFALYPKLFLIRANLYLQVGEHALALPLLTKADETIAQYPSFVNSNELSWFQASILITRSKVLYQMGDYLQAQKLCQQVIEPVAVDDVALRAEAYMHLGVCANLLGAFSKGIAHFQKALQLWGREHNSRQTAELHTALAGAYRLVGNLALAEHHLACATNCWDYLQNEWGKVNNLIHAGQIKHQQGEFSEAEALLRKALLIARGHIHFLRGEAYTLVSLGALYHDQGLYSQSLTFTAEGLTLARRLKDRYLANSTLCVQAMTYLFMGDSETALLLVSEVEFVASTAKGSAYEKAKRDLTLGTILLCREQQEEAYNHLIEAEKQFHATGLQEDLLNTTLHLAECEVKQGQLPEALRRMETLNTPVQSNNYWKQSIVREFRILPALTNTVRTQSELAWLRDLLQLEAIEKKHDASNQLPARPPVVEQVVDNAPQLKIYALGEPAVFINEEAITRWRTKRATELFFLLLDSNSPLRKEQIITALWQETGEHTDGTLHSTIYRLRKLLGESCIASRTGVYWLDLPSVYTNNIWYDVTTFQAHFAQAKRALEDNDDVEAYKALSAMVNLYRGD